MRYWLFILVLPVLAAGLIGCELLGQKEVVDLTVRPNDPIRGHTSPPSRQFDKGATVSIQARPHDSWGWEFERWSGDHSGTENPLNFTIESDTELVAHFRGRLMPVTFIIEGSGHVEYRLLGSGDDYSDDPEPKYRYGTTIQVRAVPAEGWEFDVWRGENWNFNRLGNPEQISILMHRELRAIFKPVN